MKNYLGVILIIVATLVLVGCSNNSKEEESVASSLEETEAVEEKLEETEPAEPQEEVIPDGYVKSRFTGLHVEEDVGIARPYALMFNNLKEVNPQSGTSEASILYEALVEGGITRLMGVFEDLHPEKIGSIRSGRQYFASIADEYDAIFVSFGESAYCTEKITELGLNQLSGLKSEGSTVFYRVSSIQAPHNAFASKDGIVKGTELRQYNTEYDENIENHFTFSGEEFELESDQDVDKLTLKFSNYQSPYFTYDQENKVYSRFQYGGEHVDANSGDQLQFKNIIIQFVDGFSIDETRSFSFSKGSGQGFYITNGKATQITWDKNEQNRSMVYYTQEGNMLEMNPGKTYIAVFPGDQKSDVIFE